MKKNLKNNKGFTLVELLAVIVVLAVIILIAMPAVMSSMDKARRNALVTEANEIAKVAQTAFADDSFNSGSQAVCYGIHYLVENGYLDKNLDKYSGEVYLSVDTNGKVSSEIFISNGIYEVAGTPNNLSSENIKANTYTDEKCSRSIPTDSDTKLTFEKKLGSKSSENSTQES